MKMRPVGAELFHAERRTDLQRDTTKPIISLRNFSKAPIHRKTLYRYRI